MARPRAGDYDPRVTTSPPTDDFALAARATPLAPLIAAEIAREGPITFARFMALALGHTEHGYYPRAGLQWGAAGDFETAPEVHPIFGYLWARQVEECWEHLGRPAPFALVEVGAGSGSFAEAMLTWLRERAPDCFAALRMTVLDGSPRRVEEQRQRLAPHAVEAQPEQHVDHALLDDWLARDEPLTGVLISNELFDALPVHLVEQRDGVLHEWHVVLGAAGAFTLDLLPASTPELAAHFEALGVWPGEGCRAEVSLAAPELMQRLAARLARGYIVSIDYGHDAAALYARWRRMGTLMAFRAHSPQPDPLALPGLTDLTAHVDLTALAAAAVSAGCEVAPHVSQAEALTALGIGDALEAARARAAEDLGAYASARRAAETLLDPAGLGRIRVLVAAKGAPLDLRCLAPLDPPRAAR